MTGPGGIAWRARLFKEFTLSAPPALELDFMPLSKGQFGLFCPPILEFDGRGTSTAAFELAAPPTIEPNIPALATFELAAPPDLSFIGRESYPRAFDLAAPPSMEFVGRESYPRAFELAAPPTLTMTGVGRAGALENTSVTNLAVPAGVTGCWVTLIGAGSSGSNTTGSSGFDGQTPGGGGGARVDRIWIPVASLGTTITVVRGLGGARGANAKGGDSKFQSGAITLTAGGGSVGTGGVASASGIDATGHLHNGKNGNTSDATDDVGAGGGNGGASNGGAQPGTNGGSSKTVTGGLRGSPGAKPADAAPGHGGAGGGGGSSYSGAGGDGGLYGGGGGGAGQAYFSSAAQGGKGGDGYTKVEWAYT